MSDIEDLESIADGARLSQNKMAQPDRRTGNGRNFARRMDQTLRRAKLNSVLNTPTRRPVTLAHFSIQDGPEEGDDG